MSMIAAIPRELVLAGSRCRSTRRRPDGRSEIMVSPVRTRVSPLIFIEICRKKQGNKKDRMHVRSF